MKLEKSIKNIGHYTKGKIKDIQNRIENGAEKLLIEYGVLYHGTLREAFNLGRLMPREEYFRSKYLDAIDNLEGIL